MFLAYRYKIKQLIIRIISVKLDSAYIFLRKKPDQVLDY